MSLRNNGSREKLAGTKVGRWLAESRRQLQVQENRHETLLNETPADKATSQTGGNVDTKSLIGCLEQTEGEGREIMCLFAMVAIGVICSCFAPPCR